jgi:hypothetical protein
MIVSSIGRALTRNGVVTTHAFLLGNQDLEQDPELFAMGICYSESVATQSIFSERD